MKGVEVTIKSVSNKDYATPYGFNYKAKGAHR
jgi:hypothetical protein